MSNAGFYLKCGPGMEFGDCGDRSDPSFCEICMGQFCSSHAIPVLQTTTYACLQCIHDAGAAARTGREDLVDPFAALAWFCEFVTHANERKKMEGGEGCKSVDSNRGPTVVVCLVMIKSEIEGPVFTIKPRDVGAAVEARWGIEFDSNREGSSMGLLLKVPDDYYSKQPYYDREIDEFVVGGVDDWKDWNGMKTALAALHRAGEIPAGTYYIQD